MGGSVTPRGDARFGVMKAKARVKLADKSRTDELALEFAWIEIGSSQRWLVVGERNCRLVLLRLGRHEKHDIYDQMVKLPQETPVRFVLRQAAA